MPERQAVEYHDFKLDDGKATPTTSVTLMLAEDENGRKRWREARLPPFPQRQSEGPVGYAHYDPRRDLVWSQKTWHGGALHQIYRSDTESQDKYLQAAGVDLRWEGVAVLGMARSQQVSILVPNVGWESGAAGGWTLTAGSQGGSAGVITTTPRTGVYHLELYHASGGTASTAEYRIPNYADYIGRSLTFALYGRVPSGSTPNPLQIQIGDGIGGNTAESLSSTTSYAYLAVTRTIQAGATMLQLIITTTGASRWYADDMVLLVSSNDSCVGTAEAVGKLYAAIGPLVLRWDETNDFWESVFCEAAGAVATDIISFNDRIFVAYGYNTSYVYGLGDTVTKTATTIAFVEGGASPDTITDSGNGFVTAGFKPGDPITVSGSTSNNGNYTIQSVAAGTITLIAANDLTAEAAGASVTIKTRFAASIRTAPDDKAGYWATRRNQLWKSESGNGVSNIAPTNATEAGRIGTNADSAQAWLAPYIIASESTDITALHSFRDSILPGKENGMYFFLEVYEDGTSAAIFRQVALPFATLIDADNFARGAEWWGRLYLIAAQQSLFYFDGEFLVNISSLLFSPRAGHTGRVRAIAGDPSNLFLLVDSNVADTSATKTTWLLSLRELGGRWFVHTLDTVPVGIIETLDVHNGYLYGLGRLYHAGLANYFLSCYRWTLPTKSIAPAFDATPAIRTQGNFDTYVWDGGMPDEDKAFIAVTIFCKGSVMDAQHTIVVDFGIDGAASTGTNLGTFSGTGNIQTKFFNTITTPHTNAIGKSIQLNIELNTDDTVSPELYAFALHATLRPTRVKTWELYTQIGEGLLQYNGQPDPESKATKLASLNTLENQVYPIQLTEDFDENETPVSTRVQIIPGTLERITTEERQEGVEIYRLWLQEVPVA